MSTNQGVEDDKVTKAQEPARRIAMASLGDQTTNSQNCVTNVKKYLELCVNVSRHSINLGEINVSSIASDGQLFDEIWKTYCDIKGKDWKATLRNWFLEPDDVLFVLVSSKRLGT